MQVWIQGEGDISSLSGISVSPLGDRYAYIVDIGADCVRKFRYR